MALFGKLFEKKNCAICGKELGMFGKTKIAEGHICKDCSEKLSPFFTGRRNSTAEQIREQLDYREKNKERLTSFNPTTTIDGGNRKVYLDEDQACLIITGARNWRDANPDIIEFSQVTGCDIDIDEDRTEIFMEDAEGNEVSYNPPRYEYEYDFTAKVFFNHPYFSQTSWKINTSTIDGKGSTEYHDTKKRADTLQDRLTTLHAATRAAAAPRHPVSCPHCFATTTPTPDNCCEYCGGSLAEVTA